MENFFENYESFYNMALAVTCMSNTKTPQLLSDGKKVVEFIGRAYGLGAEYIEKCASVITDELVSIGLTADKNAVLRNRGFSDECTETVLLTDIKCDILTRLENIGKSDAVNVNSNWFDYSTYKPYNPYVRFYQINAASTSGDPVAVRQAGIMLALGIGCRVSYKEAIWRFTQCAFWGDVPSMRLLAYTYALEGNDEKSAVFYELAKLCDRYLKSGRTVLPEEAKKQYCDEACTYYVYISSIKQDVIFAYGRTAIDFSFIEAISSDSLDYYKKMEYIDNYEKKEWKNVTNSHERVNKKLGFC